jgi:uncharacterized protein YceK
MKRIVIFLMVAMLGCASVMAQEVVAEGTQEVKTEHWRNQRNTLQISAGWVSGFWCCKQLFAWIPAAAGHSRNWDYFGNYGLQYYYQVNWYCRVGGKLNWEIDAYDIYESKAEDAKKKGVTRNNTVSLVASVQFTYLNRPHVQLYSGADVGVGAHFANTRYEPDYTGDKQQPQGAWLPAVNITPIGVAFGIWQVYGYVETNVGYESFIKAGLGVHF